MSTLTPPAPEPTRSGRHSWPRVLFAVAVFFGLVIGSVFVAMRLSSPLKGAFSGIGFAITGVGAFDAANAVSTAGADGVNLDQVTTAQLAERNGGHWIAGSQPSTRSNVTSISVAANHILTATLSPGGTESGCSFGLYVANAQDPILPWYGLTKPGVYLNYQNPADACSAINAPTAGWSEVSPSELYRVGASLP